MPCASAGLLHLTTRPKLWADWFQLQGALAENAFVGLRFDQFSMIVAAVTAGLGVALLPTFLVEHEIKMGSLILLLPLPMQTENVYCLVCPEIQSHVIAEKFQEWIAGEAAVGAIEGA